MYVGVVVFGLITFLAVTAYAALLISGYQAPADSPFERLFPDEERDIGEILFVSIAAVFTAAFTWFAWRRLLTGARRDAAKRRRIQEMKQEMRQYQRQRRPPGPT